MALSKATFLIFALKLAGKLSLRGAQLIGRLLGTLGWVFNSRSRKVTETNIRICFPDMPEDQRRDLSRSSLRHTGQTLMEIPLMWEWPVQDCLDLVREVEGEQLVHDAIAKGKGSCYWHPISAIGS